MGIIATDACKPVTDVGSVTGTDKLELLIIQMVIGLVRGIMSDIGRKKDDELMEVLLKLNLFLERRFGLKNKPNKSLNKTFLLCKVLYCQNHLSMRSCKILPFTEKRPTLCHAFFKF